MLEAISSSDWHLEGMGKHFQDSIRRQLAEVDKIYKYAMSKGIQHVFIPGDISDTPHMRWSTYMQLALFFRKYDGVINSYYIGGNHDRSDIENTSCDFLKLLSEHGFFKSFRIFLEPDQDRIDGTLVNFCAWPCRETMTEKEGCLNFAHVEYNGAIGDNGRALKTKHEFLSHERDFTISGHIHQYQYMKNKRAIFNGNPFQKNFGEKLPKGFVHFKARTEKKTVEVKHRFIDNNPNFRLETVIIDSPKDFQKLKDDNNLRYKLLVAPDVLVPSDLRIHYPNITGGIFNSDTKKVKAEDGIVEVLGETAPSLKIRPTTGLKKFLQSEGYSKKDINDARFIVDQAMNELGLS